MPSTYSPRLRFELVADGEQLGVWGQTTNRNLGKLIEDALAGYKSIAMPNANYTLTAINGLEDESRFLMLEFTGSLTAPRTVTVPAVSKTYLIKNSTNQVLTITPSGGTGATVPVGRTRSLMNTGLLMTDSLSFADSINLNSSTIQSAVLVTATIQNGTATFSTATINGGLITDTAVRNLPTPTLAGDAARKDYVDAIVNLVQADADAAAASAAAALLSEQNAAASEAQAALFSSIALGAANYQGDYNPATTYMVGQSVTFMGEFYYSKVDNNLNNTPMEGMFWAEADRTAEFVEVMAVTDNVNYHLALLPAPTTGLQELKVDTSGATYNPSTNTSGINISGNAATANSAISAGTATNATNSTNVNVTTTAANANYALVLSPNQTTGQKALLMDSSGGTYNPATNTAEINITGNAATANSATTAGSATSATNSTNVNVTTTATNASYPLVFSPDQTSGQKALLMDNSGGTYNPSTNTAAINISGNAATATNATNATNVSGGTASVTTLNASGNASFNANVTLGDSGADTTILNSQLSANGGVGTSGQFLTSRGANSSPHWTTLPTASAIPQRQIFTSSGTFVVPQGVDRVRVLVVGAGGGGGNAGSTAGGNGGSGGVGLRSFSVTPGSSIPVTVGVGGAGSNSTNGASGGSSSFGTLISATGGAGGVTNAGSGVYAADGVASGSEFTHRARNEFIADSSWTKSNFSYLREIQPILAGNSLSVGGIDAGAANDGNTAARVYSIGLLWAPGTPGNGRTSSLNSVLNARGGIGGIVIIEW